jgi:hypothetical protein
MDESVSEEQNYLELELGTIIQIEASTNPNIDNKIYFIDYLDDNQIRLIDTSTNEIINIGMQDGFPDEESIEFINILSIPDKKGYARQNNLTVGQGITIEFGGVEPIMVNGLITNLIEDMIEITTYPDKKVIYIDFGYKGIPQDLPIIEIRPFTIPVSEEIGEGEEKKPAEDMGNLEMTPEVDFDLEEVAITQEKIKARRQEILVEADGIIFGDELPETEIVVVVSESEKRYSISNQTNDLLDELLATVPSHKRTVKVLNKIHTMIERYEQLRTEFSLFNKEGMATQIKKKGADFKPLAKSLLDLDKSLKWIVPIVRNRKKVYDVDILSADSSDDIVPYNLSEKLGEEEAIYAQYLSGDIPDDQNKYYYLIRQSKKFATPFLNTNDTQNLLVEKNVNDNFNAIVDNLGDFYSGAIEGDKKGTAIEGVAVRTRFVNTRYILGMDHLFYPDLKKTNFAPEKQTLTTSDKLNISGFLTFPETLLRYSEINLPLTSILRKANLNQIEFLLQDFLTGSTQIDKKIISQDDSNLGEGDPSFLKNTREYTFKQTVDFEDRDDKTYSTFLNNMIPKTKDLFKLVEKYIENDSSYYAIIKYLEPFLIYTDDITYSQYKTIVEYMRDKIQQRKKIIVGSVPQFLNYINQISYAQPSLIIPLLPSSGLADAKTIIDLYDIKSSSSDDVMRDIISLDGGRLFYTALALEMLTLNTSIDVGEKLETELMEISKGMLEEKKTQDCSEFVLAKRYVDLQGEESVEADDDTDEVYFDKKYDPTRYSIMDSFTEMKLLGEDELVTQIIFHLQENVGLKEKDAIIEANALIAGKRKVREGEYAMLDRDGDIHYYIRENNRWRLDDGLRGKEVDEIAFCNLKTKCLSIKNDCGTTDANKAKLNKQLVEEILQHFEGKDHMESGRLKTMVEAELKESLRVEPLLSAIRFYELRKHDMYKVQIAMLLEDTERVSSPHQKLLDLVLSQSDFVNKQRDIGLFVEKYCRDANVGSSSGGLSIGEESPYWYYCPITNTPLLPTFFYELSEAYFDGKYIQILDQICADRGTKSDDGDMIVDKHSGYVIRQLEFEELEGFDVGGRPLTSYDLLQQDKGDILINVFEMKKESLYKDKSSQIIARVIAALDQSMRISVLSEQEFIVRHVVRRLTQELKTRKNYEKGAGKMKKKGKHMRPYDDYVNEFLLFYTLAYYLIALQSMTPSVQSVKTFGTGCKKSFKGYPVESMGDMSSLNYLACVAMNLKSDTEPWNILPSITKKVMTKIKGKGKEARVAEEKKILEGVATKIKAILDRKVLVEDEVQDKIKLKRFFLKTSGAEEEIANIPLAIDVKGWNLFLPPLITQHVEHLPAINSAFKDLLLQDMATGNVAQFDRINKLYGLMLYYSLGIQEGIQKVVNKVAIILTNKGTNVPYLENACCNDGIVNTFDYFVDGDKSIEKYNNIVKELEILYYGIREEVIAPYFFNAVDTKMKYTTLNSEYSELTIYHSFMYFCKNNINIDMTREVVSLCGDMSPTIESDAFNFKTLGNEMQDYFDILGNSRQDDIPNPLEYRIQLLKRDGFTFTNESMINLVNIVNKQRIVDIDLDPTIISAKYALEGVLKYLKDKENPVLCGKGILDKLYELMDRFYTDYSEASDEVVLNLLGYIKEHNIESVNRLLDTIGKTTAIKRTVIDFIKEINPSQEGQGSFKKNKKRQGEYILNWKERGENIFMGRKEETDYTTVEYLKTMVINLCKVYPNIIINKNSFKNKKIPKHWKLSQEFHIKDIQDIIHKEYVGLEQYFGEEDLDEILKNVIRKTDDLIMLMEATPFFAENKNKTIMNGAILKELMFFYLMCSFNIYMDSVIDIPVDLVIADVSKFDEEDVEESTSNLAMSLETELLEGRNETRNEKLNNLLVSYLKMMISYKGVLNYSNVEIIENVLKLKEKEKNKITKRLGDLSPEEREIENIMKNQRLGDWSLGQTKALFVYDEQQYDKERREMDRDALLEFRMGDHQVTDMDGSSFDALSQMDIDKRIDSEVYALNTIAEDDDMGDDDDQVRLDYGDL